MIKILKLLAVFGVACALAPLMMALLAMTWIYAQVGHLFDDGLAQLKAEKEDMTREQRLALKAKQRQRLHNLWQPMQGCVFDWINN